MSQCRYPPQRMSVGSPAEEGSPWGPRSRPVRFSRFPSHKPNCRFGIPTGGDAKVEDRPSLADRHLVVFKTQTEPSNWLDRVLVKGSRKPQSGPLSLLEGGTPGRISAVSQNKKLPRIHSRRISEVQPLSYRTDHPSGGVWSSINLFRQDAMHIITARDTEV